MPWDAKPAPPPSPQAPPQSAGGVAPNGLPPTPYTNYDTQVPSPAVNGARIKTEPQSDNQYGGLPNTNYAPQSVPQGGLARAQQLMQQQYGQAANASVNAMQQQPRGGLALPGQQQQGKPQGLQLPQQGQMQGQHQQYSPQQQQAYHQQRMQQAQQQQQQGPPRIKTETESPQMPQGGFQQQQPVNYSQTDGAGDEDAMQQWQAMLAERRAAHAAQGQEADRLMRDQVSQISADLENGLMVPLSDKRSRKQRRKRNAVNTVTSSSIASSSNTPGIPQLDGDVDDDTKGGVKDEDDEDAINSDLDDSDEEGQGEMDNDEDDEGDSILCTYDKVQRVKNKWKCTLKDGVMSVNGKEWVFHKGTGEFEW